jgi:hypothetical protein
MNVFKTEALASATKLLSNQDDIQPQLSTQQIPHASMFDVRKGISMSKLLRERHSRFSADMVFFKLKTLVVWCFPNVILFDQTNRLQHVIFDCR